MCKFYAIERAFFLPTCDFLQLDIGKLAYTIDPMSAIGQDL